MLSSHLPLTAAAIGCLSEDGMRLMFAIFKLWKKKKKPYGSFCFLNKSNGDTLYLGRLVNSRDCNESGPVFPESCHSHWQWVINMVGLPLECCDLLPKPRKDNPDLIKTLTDLEPAVSKTLISRIVWNELYCRCYVNTKRLQALDKNVFLLFTCCWIYALCYLTQ